MSGTHTLAMTVPCNSEPWFAVTQSLAAYAGQMVRLRVRFSSDAQDKSWFHLDDVEWSVLSATLGMAEKISAGIVVTKTSNVMSDPANGSINPKAIPGAVVRYCVLIANNGPAAADLLSATDALPLQTGFVPGTLRTAANCTTIGASEDDDALGADEADPVGAGFAAGTITANLGTLSNGATIALLYDVVVQ